MSDQNIQIPEEDKWLVDFFKHFETILSAERSKRNYSNSEDFRVFSKFLIRDIQEIQGRLKNADEDYLYYVCRHIFNIVDWINLVIAAGVSNFGEAFEQLFDEKFGDRHVLQNIYDTCLEKWLSQKGGQWKIGENLYNIIEGNLYYRNRFGQWFEVDKKTAFDVKPNKELAGDNDLINRLNGEYKETWYDAILEKWEGKQYRGVLPDNFLKFENKETSPEEYFNFAVENIKTLLKNPVSIAELERWNGGKVIELEDIVKIGAFVLDVTQKRQKDNSHTLYLLRDCLMFNELHKTLDILNSEETSSDQILVGRKLLTHKQREWGYYIVMLEVLYLAHDRYPTNFTEFYNEYARLLDMFVSLNPGFAEVVAELADYIKKHIKTDKNKIVIFDIGFQGSIALLVKYIIDRHIKPIGPNGKIETDIKIGVGAEWSKELFGDRYENDCFPLLNRVQLMARSDELYHYKTGSLNSGKLLVTMGSEEWQHKAAIELVVLVMLALMSQGNK